jgi:hypothetical protein
MEWKTWGIGVAVTVVCAFILRMAKTQKWAQRMQSAGVHGGKWVSILLLRWLPPVAAEKAEEGPIITALELAKSFLDGLEIGLLSDNKKRLEKKGENVVKVGLIIIAALVLAGCSKKTTIIETVPDFAPAVENVAEPTPEPIADGPVMILPPEPVTVYFDFDSDRLPAKESMKLDHLIGKECIIDAHACAWGTDGYNLALSERRGNMVKLYIGGGKVTAWGETQCNAPCNDIEEAECLECRKVIVRVK